MIEGLRRGRPAFLASVTNADEAGFALLGGADVIDCKDPSSGALGALDEAIVREIVARIAGRLPVSATVGDLPAEPGTIVAAVSSMAATGVDIVKIGFFGDRDPRPAIEALGKEKRLACPSRRRADGGSKSPITRSFPFWLRTVSSASCSIRLTRPPGSLTSTLPAGGLSKFVPAARASGLSAVLPDR